MHNIAACQVLLAFLEFILKISERCISVTCKHCSRGFRQLSAGLKPVCATDASPRLALDAPTFPFKIRAFI